MFREKKDPQKKHEHEYLPWDIKYKVLKKEIRTNIEYLQFGNILPFGRQTNKEKRDFQKEFYISGRKIETTVKQL